GDSPTDQRGPTAPSNAILDLDIRKSGWHRSSFVKSATLVTAGIVVALGVAGLMLLKKPQKPTLREARHMTPAGVAQALSRDGKLLAYASTIGGDVPHIWLQQTAGGEAIPVTSGPDTDFWPDFSPDGTHIAFWSTRGGGGIYIGPTLPGEPRLVVSNPDGGPRFSPSGHEILYLRDHKLFAVSFDGAQPVALALNQDFLVDGPWTLWAPSGNEIIFYGVRKREAEKPDCWWIAPFKGGDPRPARLPRVERDNRMGLWSVRSWTRTNDGRE